MEEGDCARKLEHHQKARLERMPAALLQVLHTYRADREDHHAGGQEVAARHDRRRAGADRHEEREHERIRETAKDVDRDRAEDQE